MTDRRAPERDRGPVYGRIRLSFGKRNAQFGGDLSKGYDEDSKYSRNDKSSSVPLFAAVTAALILSMVLITMYRHRKKQERRNAG